MRVCLAAYPKVGSTWLRFFLANVMSNSGKEQEDWVFTDFNTVHDIVPDYDNGKEYSGQRIAKTHMLQFLFDKYDFDKTILLIRNPYDTMVSLYYYYMSFGQRRRGWQKVEKTQLIKGKHVEIFKKVDLGINDYVAFVNSYSKIGNIITYEQLRTMDKSVYSYICDYCDIEYTDELLEWSMEKAHFDNMTKVEDERGKKYSVDFKFCRSGEVGQWKEELDEYQTMLISDAIKGSPILEEYYG